MVGNMARLRYKTLKTALFISILFLSMTTAATDQIHLRGSRYCEILLSQNMLTYDVYNTIGLNDCPETLWKTITIDNIKQEAHARFVILNGPRIFMMDSIKNTHFIQNQPKLFHGLAMRKAGILRLSIMELLVGKKAYREHKVKRYTTWIYDAGKPIYELIDSEGKVFVLQSYSLELLAQNPADLAKLGEHLKLPEGWRFHTEVLKKPIEIIAQHHTAIVIQDDFLNTYQLAESIRSI